MVRLLSLFEGESPQEVADSIGAAGSAVLKRRLADAVNDGLADHRARRAELIADPGYLRSVLQDGNRRAAAVADRTLADVLARMGMS